MTKHAHRMVYALLVLFLACGCQFDLMTDGTVIFEDETPRPEGRYFDLDRPVAVGADVNLVIESGGFASTIALDSVTIADPSILEIKKSDARGVSLRALRAGETTLTATMTDGRIGTLSIETREVSSAELKLFPWEPRIAIDPSLWEDGVALLEGSATRVYVELRAQDGTILTGYGARAPTLSNPELARLVPAEESDFYTLSNEVGTGFLELSVADGDSYAIDVVGFEAVSRIGLSNPLHPDARFRDPAYDGETLEFYSRGDLLHVDARTTDGRYVMGNSGLSLGVNVNEETELSIVLGDENLAEDDDFIQRALNRGRAFLMAGRTDGPEEIEIAWGHLTARITVESR